ncbi:MAG: type II toxin-antitoxin system VapC family toxin [Acidimicrobiia bacterium]|nr:PIN domain nuclease [bacterium]MCY3651987.1 PIN domain nuclease [bacterium]MXX65303.1 type II toxin-antitoxin system VapC family toxin [Acidimicrobiia bacterium]MYD03401.1 type II toxin-antitoxin system VapC family toxin [Acidimicrobiia bacterium]MYH55876.1 type II toxin-antitoxin system VapC family toxin [Acidimicrobiia bacterium]
MTLILDTGALIAVESSDREVLSLLQEAFLNHEEVHVPAGVIAQAWRKPERQVLLTRTLKQCKEIPLDGETARSCGQLCGKTRTDDVIDASVAIAEAKRFPGGVTLLTSDRRDMQVLLSVSGISVDLVDV